MYTAFFSSCSSIRFSFNAIFLCWHHTAYRLSVSQRQCRFAHESDILETSPIYSFNLCQNECRLRLALRTCGCVPHFYRSKSKFILPFNFFLFFIMLRFFLRKLFLEKFHDKNKDSVLMQANEPLLFHNS